MLITNCFFKQFAGDAVLAMWANGPLWLNTLQAVQCAVEMQQKLNAWKAGEDGEMNLHVGIGCGRVSALHLGGFEVFLQLLLLLLS